MWRVWKREKKGKDDEIKGEAFGHLKWGRKEVKSQSVSTSAVLKNCVSESKQKRKEKKRKIGRVRENTQWGRKQ